MTESAIFTLHTSTQDITHSTNIQYGNTMLLITL